MHDLWSPEVETTFRVFVGHCGAEPRATIVVTDGNGLFGLTVDVVRLMQIPGLLPPLKVVAVGYPGAQTVADTIDVRNRDLTSTPWPAFPGSGGADRFLGFIRATLFDWINERFPAALETPVYFGHSLGGLFGTCALLDPRPPFSHFILSSPSLFWDRYAVFDREAEWSASPPDRELDAFFGIGGLETDEGRRLEGQDLPDGHPRRPRWPRTSTWWTTSSGSPNVYALGDIPALTSPSRYTPTSTTPPSRRSYLPTGCAGSSAPAEGLSR